MARIIYSPDAERDLIDISSFIAMDNPAAADRLIDSFVDKLRVLADSPLIGPICIESPTLRRFPVGNYVFFYRPMSDGIELVRVLHGARDLRALFNS